MATSSKEWSEAGLGNFFELTVEKSILNILITGTGGPTARSFARSIKMSSYKKMRLFGTDIHPYAIGLYQDKLFEKSFITPKSSEEGYWIRIEEIIENENVDLAVILPESEVETWSMRLARTHLPCPALVPNCAVVRTMMDKAKLSEVLYPYGLTPQTIIIRSGEEALPETIADLGIPFWIRSSSGSSGMGSFLIKEREDLSSWLSLNQGIQTFIASKYLPGRNLACKLLYYHGKLIRSAVGERVTYIMSKTSPSGITGNTAFGRLLNEQETVNIARQGVELVFKEVNLPAHGFFTVDLKEAENGRPLITEINIRHVAFTSAFAMAGANFCEDMIRLLDQDSTFDYSYRQYLFEERTIFLREVDALPILMNEDDLIF